MRDKKRQRERDMHMKIEIKQQRKWKRDNYPRFFCSGGFSEWIIKEREREREIKIVRNRAPWAIEKWGMERDNALRIFFVAAVFLQSIRDKQCYCQR